MFCNLELEAPPWTPVLTSLMEFPATGCLAFTQPAVGLEATADKLCLGREAQFLGPEGKNISYPKGSECFVFFCLLWQPLDIFGRIIPSLLILSVRNGTIGSGLSHQS